MRILVVEDDRAISHFLVKGLREERHVVDLVEDGVTAEEWAAVNECDLVILDVMLPGLDGVEVCRRLRAQRVDTPILMLTARHETQDRITGLDAGADDYLVKPFAFEELLARVRALGRRGRSPHLTTVREYGPIRLDTRDHVVQVNGQRLDLTATEFRLLECLLARPGAIVTREQLSERVWGRDPDTGSNLVEVYVGYLRRKLQGVEAKPLVHTVRGLGYMLKT